MRSKEKIAEEIVLIRYYNVLFYLFFKTGMDDFKRQCLISLLREVEYMPCYADWRERRELKHLHICSGIILQMQDEKMDGN